MKSPLMMQALVNEFNRRVPIGSKVQVRTDRDGIRECTVKYAASIMGGHTPVAWLTELGAYALDRVLLPRHEPEAIRALGEGGKKGNTDEH